MTSQAELPFAVPEEILRFYRAGNEAVRLANGIGPLEQARAQELILRYLPPTPATICDIGGGPGTYSLWLAELGYDVHLVDVVPLHIEQAKSKAEEQSIRLASAQVGDGRALPFADESADAVILHGPLYHLTERADRLRASSEAKRVLRPDGVLLAFAISRYASTIVGLIRGWIFDPAYLEMVKQEIATGQHRQPANWPGLFTTAYFHQPDELKAELAEAGMDHEATLAVQGPAWMVPDFEANWQDQARRGTILTIARLMESEPAMSPHMVAVAYRPSKET